MAKKVVGYIELHWRCPNCDTQNPGSEKSCVACGNPQPPDVEFYQVSNAELLTNEEKIKAAKIGPDVHCPYCGTRNAADAETCLRCGGDLEDAHQRVAGKVLGAFGSDPHNEHTELMCPSCNQPNASDVKYCVHCGSPIKPPPTAKPSKPVQSQPPKTSTTDRKRLSPIVIVVLALVALGCIGALAFALIFGGTGSEPVMASVSDVDWQVSIEIEEQRYVEQEGWRDDVPGSAQNLFCQEELYSTSDLPSPGAVEVCGEPYTVDLGNGMAEVRQDCEYQIYEDYCSYEVLDWVVVDTVTYDGNDNDPYWSEPNLSTGQVVGSTTESYRVEFSGDDRTFEYRPEDLYEFQLLTPGSEWELELNLFGGIKSISPVK